jgi:nitrate reductase NapE component
MWVAMSFHLTRRELPVPDLVFVLLTVALFAVLALAVRGGERL